MTLPKLLRVLNYILMTLFLAALLLAPIAVDRVHMGDMVFLGTLGWRGVNGLIPVIDYPHFYGGMTSWFVTAAFNAFGVSYKSLNYAFAMMFVVASGVLWGLSWRRLSGSAITLLLTLAAALIISLDPIEYRPFLGIAHSFVYNHVGIVLMMALTLFASKSIGDRKAEGTAAFVAGVATYGLILLKTTFGVMLPCVVLACLVQRRWSSAALVTVGATAGMLAMDPWMTRSIGSLLFILEGPTVASAGGVEGRLWEALSMLQAHTLSLSACMVQLIAVGRRNGADSLPLIASLLICGLGYGAAALTMDGSSGQKLLPFLTVASLLLVGQVRTDPERTQTNAPVAVAELPIWQALPFGLAYVLILPALVVSADAFSNAVRYSRASLVSEGPLSTYFVVGPATSIPGMQATEAAERRAAAVAETLGHIRAGTFDINDRSNYYVIFADGVSLLQQIPDITSYGIVTNSRMFDFTMPLLSKVVPSFPVWPVSGLPGLADRTRLGADVDLVMMVTDIPIGLLNEDLLALMGDEFRVCQQSELWTLFARRTLIAIPCNAGNIAP